jgi:hypothetical protein
MNSHLGQWHRPYYLLLKIQILKKIHFFTPKWISSHILRHAMDKDERKINYSCEKI